MSNINSQKLIDFSDKQKLLRQYVVGIASSLSTALILSLGLYKLGLCILAAVIGTFCNIYMIAMADNSHFYDYRKIKINKSFIIRNTLCVITIISIAILFFPSKDFDVKSFMELTIISSVDVFLLTYIVYDLFLISLLESLNKVKNHFN